MKSHKSRQISSTTQSPPVTRSNNKTLTTPNPNPPPPPPPSTPSRPPPPNSAAMSSPSTPDSASRGNTNQRRRSTRLAGKSGTEEEGESSQGKDLIDSENLGPESEVRVSKGRVAGGSGSGRSDPVRRSSRIASKVKSGGEEDLGLEVRSGEKRKNENLGSGAMKIRVLDFGGEEKSGDVEMEKEKEKDGCSQSGIDLNKVGDKEEEEDMKEMEEVVVPDSPAKSTQLDGNVGSGVLRRRSQRLAPVKESNEGSSSIGNLSDCGMSSMTVPCDKEGNERSAHELGDGGSEVIERMEVPGGHNLATGGTKRRSPRLAHVARTLRLGIGNAGGEVDGNTAGYHNPEISGAGVASRNRGFRVGELNLDLNSTPNSQEKKVKLDLNLKPEEQAEGIQGMDTEDSSLVISAANALMQLPQSIESERAMQDVRWRARSRTLRMERFQDIARERASHFAHFRAEENETDATDPTTDTVDPPEETEDWPGPFSTAMKIIKERNKQLNLPRTEDANQAASSTAPVIHWVPSKNSAENRGKLLVPSLQDLCLKILSKNAEAIASLKFVPNELKNRLTHMLCDLRKMNGHFMDLLVADSPEVVRVKDCSWLTEEQFTKTFVGCDATKLSELQLDLSGRCMTDYVIRDTLARSPNCLPALVAISLKGACRLTDIGLGSLVASSPSLRSINLSQCSLITSVGIDTIASRLGLLLKELYLDDCQSIDAMLMLPSLKKLRCLEVLSVADILTVSDDFVCQFVTDHGPNMKELGLANCLKVTDRSIKAISENCSALRALDLSNLRKLTDISIAHLANGCLSLQNLKLRSNQLSDEAISAFLETSGHSLKELSLNGVKKVGPNTAISLAKSCTSNLQCLDLSWCRNLVDDALGHIVDSCSSLRLLKLFGCTQITNVFVDGHSNHQLRIIGLAMTPILEHLDVLDSQDGQLRYSYVPSLPV